MATWSDFENVSPGERLYDQLQQALDQAKFYLIVVGPRNIMRDWQDQEWQGALERTWTDPDKRIIPVLVGDAEAPAFLRNWAPFRLQPGHDESASARELAEIIKRYPRRSNRRSRVAGWGAIGENAFVTLKRGKANEIRPGSVARQGTVGNWHSQGRLANTSVRVR